MNGFFLLRCSLLSAFCVAVSGCSLPGKPKPGPEVPRPDSVLDFATLYKENCAGCHGANGMNGPSYPLANPVYQAVVDDATLRGVIANGTTGSLMPAFAISAGGMLTDAQVDALVKGMRAAWYKTDALGGATPPSYRVAKSADTGSASKPNAKPSSGLNSGLNSGQGEQVYTAYCASCHGAAGSTAKSKAGSITEPAFLTLVSDQELRTIVIAGRPDIGQPDWRNDLPGHPMSDQQVTDVVGWLGGQRHQITTAPGATTASVTSKGQGESR